MGGRRAVNSTKRRAVAVIPPRGAATLAPAVMVARITTVAFQGVDVVDVDVQVHLGGGLPNFIVVGLLDKTVAEARERVGASLAALGLALPPRRITVNLSPADLAKEGSHYDLPIAVGLLAAMGVVEPQALTRYAAIGELALDGQLTA